jgi:hypothetical protein
MKRTKDIKLSLRMRGDMFWLAENYRAAYARISEITIWR